MRGIPLWPRGFGRTMPPILTWPGIKSAWTPGAGCWNSRPKASRVVKSRTSYPFPLPVRANRASLAPCAAQGGFRQSLQPRSLATCRDIHALGAGGDSVGQRNAPSLFTFVDLKNYAAFPGRMVGWRVQQQEARPQLGNRNGIAIKNQMDPHICGVAAVSTVLKIDD